MLELTYTSCRERLMVICHDSEGEETEPIRSQFAKLAEMANRVKGIGYKGKKQKEERPKTSKRLKTCRLKYWEKSRKTTWLTQNWPTRPKNGLSQAGRPFVRSCEVFLKRSYKRARQDSNLQPSDSKSATLSNWATGANVYCTKTYGELYNFTHFQNTTLTTTTCGFAICHVIE